MTSVSVISDVPGQGRFLVTFTKTGADTANFDVKEYPAGSSTSITPTTDNNYDVTDVRVVGTVLTCQTSVFMQTPKLAISLSDPGDSPSLRVVITNTWFSDEAKLFPISAANHAAIVAFLHNAAFPAV